MLQDFLLKQGYTKIKLHLTKTNHFEIIAKINGVKGLFILDTGASNSCLDITLADQFKLKVEESETKAAGAGAIGMETKIATNNTIKFKGWKYKKFSLVLLDLTHVNTALTEHHAKAVHGIIGADILEKGNAIIDYKDKCVYLKKLVFKH